MEASFFNDIKDVSPYMLAEMAGCQSPKHRESPGAVLLAELRDNLIEAWEQDRFEWGRDRDDSDVYHEVIAETTPNETLVMWAVFADLMAWEEKNDYAADGDQWSGTWEGMGYQAVGQILDRLAAALMADMRVAQGGWECPQCGDSGQPLLCSPDACTDEPAVGADDGHAEAVLTGPVDLPAVSDPILDLLAAVEAPRTVPVPVTESDTQKFMRRMAEINDGDDDLAPPFRPGKWVAVACVAVWVVVMLIVVDWPF